MWDPVPLWCPLCADNAISTCEVLNQERFRFREFSAEPDFSSDLTPLNSHFVFKATPVPRAVPSDAECCLMCLEGNKTKIKPSSCLSLQSLQLNTRVGTVGNPEPHLSPPKSANDFAGSHLASAEMPLSGKSASGNKKPGCSKINSSRLEKIGLSLLATLFFISRYTVCITGGVWRGKEPQRKLFRRETFPRNLAAVERIAPVLTSGTRRAVYGREMGSPAFRVLPGCKYPNISRINGEDPGYSAELRRKGRWAGISQGEKSRFTCLSCHVWFLRSKVCSPFQYYKWGIMCFREWRGP